MKLSKSESYYSQDQGIKQGTHVVVWQTKFIEDKLVVNLYERFAGEHLAGGNLWKYACPVYDLIEIDGSGTNPKEVSPSSYGEVWVKAYATSGSDQIADDALAGFKAREAKGDFDKTSVAVDPIV